MSDRVPDDVVELEINEDLLREARELLKETQTLIMVLDEHHRNVNIARITGSSVSLTGGILAIVGGSLTLTGVLAPVGVPLAIAGMGVGAAGASTNIGCRVAKYFLTKKNLSDLQAKIDSFQSELGTRIAPDLPLSNFSEGVKDGLAIGGTGANIGRTVFTIYDTAGDIWQAVSAARAGKAATSVAVKAAGTFGKLSIIGSAILMPIDIAEIALVSQNMYKGKGHPACENLRKFAAELEKFLQCGQRSLEENSSSPVVFLQLSTFLVRKTEQPYLDISDPSLPRFRRKLPL